MMRSLAAVLVAFSLSVPAFAQGPSTTIVNYGSYNVNRVSNVAPVYYPPVYPGVYVPQGPQNFIQNVGHGNVNVIRNSGYGGYGASNTIVNVGNGNYNRIINR